MSTDTIARKNTGAPLEDAVPPGSPARRREPEPEAAVPPGYRRAGKDKAPEPEEPPDLIAKSFGRLWRGRAIHGPVTILIPIYLTAQSAYTARGGQDLALTLIPTAAGIGASCYHRVHRRRTGRPLVRGQQLWQFAASLATGLYLGIASLAAPRDPAMLWLLGALDAPLAATWWLRGKLITPDAALETAAEPEPEVQDAQPEPAVTSLAEAYAAAWASGIAGPRGRIPNSALTEITENTPELGGGVTGTAVLSADGGAITHVPENVAEIKQLIHQAMLRANPKLHPSNLLIEPQTNGTALVKLLEHNPLARVETARPSGPGTFTHRVGRTSSGEPVTMTLYVKGFGSRHRAFVGSTGSGKSSVMNLMIGMDGHTFTADGRPLVCPIICDPHGGVSYAPWHGLVRIAHTPEQIAGALLLACIEIKRRLEWMRVNRIDLIVPSPEMPLIPVYIDEVLSARRLCAAAGYPIEPMLEMIANEGRKTGVTEHVGMPAFSEEVLYSTLILDALSGLIAILRSKAASTGLKINTGNWSQAANPQNIIAEFADGTPTTGVGYYLRGEQAPLTVRYDYADATISDGAAFALYYPISHVDFTTVLPSPDEKGKMPDMLVDLYYWADELTSRARSGRIGASRLGHETDDEHDSAQEHAPGASGAPTHTTDPGVTEPIPASQDAPPHNPHTPAETEAAEPDDVPYPASVTAPAADEDDEGIDAEAVPFDPLGKRPSLLEAALAEGDVGAWQTLTAVLAGVGAPMSVAELHTATGIKKSAISMAISRRRDFDPPVIVRIPVPNQAGVYALPAFAHVPYLGGTK